MTRLRDLPVVVLEPALSVDKALKLFDRRVTAAGIRRELRKREAFTKPSQARRLKSRRARLRAAKRRVQTSVADRRRPMTCRKCGGPGHFAKTCLAKAVGKRTPPVVAGAGPARPAIRPDVRKRFRAVMVRAIVKADRAQAEHLARLRKRRDEFR